MRPFIPTPKHALIASMLLQGKTGREIARALKENPGTVARIIKRMVKYGYIVRDVRSSASIYSLTLLGYSLLDMLRDKKAKGNRIENTLTGSQIKATPTEKPKQFWRLHALQFKIPLVEAFSPESIHLIQFKDHPTKLRTLNNHADLIVDFQNFTATMTTRALKISGIQIRLPYDDVEDPDILLDKARDAFLPEIENLEMLFHKHFPRFRFRRLANNVIDAKVIKGELALEQDLLAMKVGAIQKETGEKLKIYDPEDGKLSEIVDFSMGPDVPEFESVHPAKFLDNMRVYKAFLEDLNSGKFYERFESIQKVQEEQQAILKKTQEISIDNIKRTDESVSQVIDLIQKMSMQFYASLNELKNVLVEVKK